MIESGMLGGGIAGNVQAIDEHQVGLDQFWSKRKCLQVSLIFN
jgi:hypothetical protein